MTRSFTSRTLAKKWARDVEARLERGEVLSNEAHQHTLSEAIERFLALRPDLGRDARRSLQWWTSEHGHARLSAITPLWITTIRDGLLGEPVTNPQDGKQYLKGAGHANKLLAMLSAALGKGSKGKPGGALAWGWLQANPVALVARLPEPPGRTRWLTDEERSRLLSACGEVGEAALRPLVLCALSCGARVSELLALRWRDIDLQAGRGVIHSSKAGPGRTLHFVGEALEALATHAKAQSTLPEAFVFSSDETGRFPFQYAKPFRAAVVAAKVADFRFHDLRHTAASYLAQSGASLLQVGQVLGHRSQQTTMRYAHLAADDAGELVERVLGLKLAKRS